MLFGPTGVRYLHPPPALLEDVKQMAGVSSVQITFHEDRAPERHAMPPGGFEQVQRAADVRVDEVLA